MATHAYGFETATLEDDPQTLEILASCGCHECSERATPGHPYCSASPKSLLAAEKRGEVWRSLDNSAWRWYMSRP
jgi:hypothetical protein